MSGSVVAATTGSARGGADRSSPPASGPRAAPRPVADWEERRQRHPRAVVVDAVARIVLPKPLHGAVGLLPETTRDARATMTYERVGVGTTVVA